VLEPAREDPGGRQVRARKQTTIRLEVVQPRRADDPERPVHGAPDVLEERGQLRHPSRPALERQGRPSARLRVLEVQAEAVIVRPRVREAAERRDDGRQGQGGRSRGVEAIRPLGAIGRLLQAGHVLLPARVGWIEVAAQAEPDVEVGVLQHGACQAQPRQARRRLGELQLQVEEAPRVDHAGPFCPRVGPCHICARRDRGLRWPVTTLARSSCRWTEIGFTGGIAAAAARREGGSS
jgi:hypothetical protein